MSAEVLIVRCGTVPYGEAVAAQRQVAERRRSGELPDVLLLLEHPPVYTRGRRSTPEELPMGARWYEAQGIEVRDTDRGGRVTYHGPGQLVGYPIVDLRAYGDDVHEHVRRLERVMIGALAEHGVAGGPIKGLTGVWAGGEEGPPPGASAAEVEDEVVSGVLRKIGSIGVHVSRGVTTHGLAVNVRNDLQPFEWIVPCGIEGGRATSIGRERDGEADLDAFADSIARRFGEIYGRTPVGADPTDLGVDLVSVGAAR